VKHLSTT